MDAPIDISDFKIIVGEASGINFKNDSNETNLETTPEQFLAMLTINSTNIKNVNEVIEESVKIV